MWFYDYLKERIDSGKLLKILRENMPNVQLRTNKDYWIDCSNDKWHSNGSIWVWYSTQKSVALNVKSIKYRKTKKIPRQIKYLQYLMIYKEGEQRLRQAFSSF